MTTRARMVRIRRFGPRLGRELVFLFLAAWAAFAVAPLAFVVLNALKNPREYLADPIGLPGTLRWENFQVLLAGGESDLPILRYLLNSVVVTAGTTILVLLVGAMAAYALSRLPFPGVRIVGAVAFWAIAIPVHVTLIPIFIMAGQLGLRNSLPGLILVYTAFWTPLTIIILRGFYDGFLSELEDAARVDGCSELGIFRRIVLPLSIGPMIGVGIVTAVGVWSELLFAITLTSRDEVRTITAGITQFTGWYSTKWHLLFPALTLSIVPLLVLYLVFQRHIQRGLAAGAIR